LFFQQLQWHQCFYILKKSKLINLENDLSSLYIN
jgi:hypothetical protein